MYSPVHMLKRFCGLFASTLCIIPLSTVRTGVSNWKGMAPGLDCSKLPSKALILGAVNGEGNGSRGIGRARSID